MALGAGVPRVFRLLLREGLAFPVAEIVLGIGGVILGDPHRSSRCEVTPAEPMVSLGTIASVPR
jgi:hypothetical protein